MESPVSFTSQGCVLRGILHAPDDAAARRSTGIVFLNGWAGYRIGPHRIFVQAARRFSAAGYSALRFDFRGRGESEGEAGAATITTMIADATAAVKALCAEAGVERAILLGLCSGSKVALGASARDPRIAGLVLWSGDPLTAGSVTAKQRRKGVHALRQYAGKLFRPATWRKLFHAQLNPRLIARALSGAEQQRASGADEAQRDRQILEQFRVFQGGVCFIYGGRDPAAPPAMEGFAAFCRANRIEHRLDVIPDADHNFTSLVWEQAVIDRTLDWLEGRNSTAAAAGR
jgi:uncharacterized protein